MLAPVTNVRADTDLARTLTEADTAANPLDPTAWWSLAIVELADGDVEKAREILERGRRRAGNHRFMNATENLIDLRDDPSPARTWVARYENDPSDEFPENFWLPAYRALGDEASVSALARRIDALPGGSAMFIQIMALSGSVPFDLADTPNFARRLDEAGIDLSRFGVPEEKQDS